jgi:hypothetical protein
VEPGKDDAKVTVYNKSGTVQWDVEKTADDGNVPSGNQIGFVITITQNGAGIGGGHLVDTLPGGFNWSIDSKTGDITCGIAAGVLTCDTNDDFIQGQSATVHIVAPTVAEEFCGPVPNEAQIFRKLSGEESTRGDEPDLDDTDSDHVDVTCQEPAASLLIQKVRDNDGDGNKDATDPFVTWNVHVDGPNGYSHDFTVTGGQLVLTDLDPGTYTVTEQTESGWVVIGVVTSEDAFMPGATSADVTLSDEESGTVTFFNQPRVSITVHKTEVIPGANSHDGVGWHFTISGCGVSDDGVTGNNGELTFSNLPPAVGCHYTVTETTETGWTASTVSQTASPTAPGQEVTLEFVNTKETPPPPGITPTPPTPTNTPVTPSPTPTNTPGSNTGGEEVNTPTPTASNTPTTPSSNTGAEGEATPVAPNTGSGGIGGTGALAAMGLAGLALMFMSAGLVVLRAARKPTR